MKNTYQTEKLDNSKERKTSKLGLVGKTILWGIGTLGTLGFISGCESSLFQRKPLTSQQIMDKMYDGTLDPDKLSPEEHTRAIEINNNIYKASAQWEEAQRKKANEMYETAKRCEEIRKATNPQPQGYIMQQQRDPGQVFLEQFVLGSLINIGGNVGTYEYMKRN